LRHARLVSRVGFLALAFVLAAVLAFAAGAATTLATATAHARSVSAIGDAYADASRAVDREEFYALEYRWEPRPAVVRRHAAAEKRFDVALAQIDRVGTPADRRVAAILRRTQRRYAAATAASFSATRALPAVRIERPFAAIRTRVEREFGRHHRDAVAASTRLTATQRTISGIAPYVTILGILSFVVLAYLLHVYRGRVDRAVAKDLERLSLAAFTDHLTSLGNHRAFQDAIASKMRRAKRDSTAFSLALIDIDEFKTVNDRLGHAQGDRVLQMLGTLLGTHVERGGAYRIGGDEFAVLLEHTTAQRAVAIAQDLRARMRHAQVGSTISVGIAALGAGIGVDALHERADAALYEAKRRGRDQVVAFDAIADTVSILTSAKVNAVRRIVAQSAVSVVFQPIVDLGKTTILGYEALARFPKIREAPAVDETFAIAERIGRAYDLDDICVTAILARAAELPQTARLFINVSPQSLDHESFVDRLKAATLAAGIEPDRVVIELTERSIERPLTVIREANRLRAAGFRLALDDVGSGNAGLALLGSLSVDFLKIDRAVVEAAASGRAGRAVYAGILAIARENGSYVIAEGIEDDAMLRFVGATRGVRGVQGYHLGRPAQTPQPIRRLMLAH